MANLLWLLGFLAFLTLQSQLSRQWVHGQSGALRTCMLPSPTGQQKIWGDKSLNSSRCQAEQRCAQSGNAHFQRAFQI